ncbi:MAG: DUF1592 domain-containing protein [Acidobacteria bacterium]|nr:DUF1592 domain-containing protein [Acidobacteriota bacterium]
MKRTLLLILAGLLNASLVLLGQADRAVDSKRALVTQYCAGCHNDRTKSGGFSWTEVDLARPEQHTERLEAVIRKLRAGMMPPAGARRPEAATLKGFVGELESRIDEAAARQPYVKPPALHRLNRTEYRNSVRDLLHIDVDVTGLLPADPRVGTFDNMADALTVTPALMQGYIRAAEKISREAVGDPKTSPAMVGYNDVNQVGKAANQFRRVEGAPFGTRGGISVIHNFPADGEYTFKAALVYHPQGQLVGARLPESIKDQQLEISVDGERVAIFTIDPEVQEYEGDLVTPPVRIKAGPRRVSVVFLSRFDGPVEDQFWLVEQLLVDTTVSGHPEMTALPHLKNFWITGPMNVTGISDTPSRRKLFSCRPASEKDEAACATEIISRLARQAYRRLITAEDMEALMAQYEVGRKSGTFDSGIQTALQAMLVNLEFIYRFERIPSGVAPGQDYRISDLELASRLSYFLWSSGPDEQLITVASQGKLKDPIELERQIKRMLMDSRSAALIQNFAGQWLRLSGLTDITPESLLFPNFTRNLAHSMRREVELLFESVMRDDRNIFDLLTADYTFVDEVLAKHYGIPNIMGPRFQRVTLTDPNRFGLLGKGAILVLTALPNRTSPVARGKYVLEVLMGTPPPTPPPNVPPLKEAGDFEKVASVRERLEQHRKVEPCRSCHQIMDPIGLAFENFDPVGLWRSRDSGSPIDPTGQMYDGTKLDGPVSVRQSLLKYPETFARNFAEHLLAYGLGRVLDHQDMPAVRSIARSAAAKNNRFSEFVLGVVKSPSFQMSRNNETEQR